MAHHPTLKYLTTTKIGEKGQVTVPKQFRQDLGIQTGAPFAVLQLGGGLILVPEQHRFEQLCTGLSSKLAEAGVTARTALASLPAIRRSVYARRYSSKSLGHQSRRSSRNRGR